MSKNNQVIVSTDTLNVCLCRDGFWLWDETRGMNLAMHAETEQAAFIDALEYYQNRLKDVESELKTLKQKLTLLWNL